MNGFNLREETEILKGANIAHIVYQTPVKLKGGKKNELQGRVEKVTSTSIMIFNNQNVNGYENMVRRRQLSEGLQPSFKVQAPVWKYSYVDNGIVEYVSKDGEHNFYLTFIKVGKNKTKYLVDGNETPENEIVGLEVPIEPEQGGIENKVDYRVVKLANIKRLSINKKVLDGSFYYE